MVSSAFNAHQRQVRPAPAGRRTRRGRRSVHRQRGSRGGAWTPADRRSGLLTAELNIQSLKPKVLELRQELARNRYDLIVLTETWMRPSTLNRLINIPGYDIHRRDRPDKTGYGGVAIVTNELLTYREIPQPSASDNSKLESLWAVVGTGGARRFILAAVYRPPRRTVAALEADFGDLERQYQSAVICHPCLPVIAAGDLNCDLLSATDIPACRCLTEFMSNFSLSQVIDRPTYSSGSLLDVILVSDRNIISRSGTRTCHFSPHQFVRAAIVLPRPNRKPAVVECRSTRHIDRFSFCSDLLVADWSLVYRSYSTAEQWQHFMDVFMPILEKTHSS